MHSRFFSGKEKETKLSILEDSRAHAENLGSRKVVARFLGVSCQLRVEEPLASLKDILTRLPLMINQDDLRPLTQRHWQLSAS